MSPECVLLVLEDDAIFVPFFKEKLNLMIESLPQSSLWMLWVGGCGNLHNDDEVNTSISIRTQEKAFDLKGIILPHHWK